MVAAAILPQPHPRDLAHAHTATTPRIFQDKYHRPVLKAKRFRPPLLPCGEQPAIYYQGEYDEEEELEGLRQPESAEEHDEASAASDGHLTTELVM